MSVQLPAVACDWYTNMVNPVVVGKMARDSHRAVEPAPESMFVMIVGVPGNVKPKFTTVVEEFRDEKDMETVPRRVQLVRLVMLVWFALMLTCRAAISVAWSVTTLARDEIAEST